MFDRGASQADVAQELEVSRETASRWYERWSEGGTETLAVIGRRGRTARLSLEQLKEVERALLEGAVANGFPNDVWTALWAPSVQSCLEAKDLLTLLRRIPVLVASGWEGTPKPRRSHR